MKTKHLLFIALFFAVNFSFAKDVSIERAKQTGKNFFYERVTRVKSINYSKLDLTLVYTETKDNQAIFYAFNINNDKGFIIVSADDATKPILGYSYEGPYAVENAPIAFKGFIDHFAAQIKFEKSNQFVADKKVQKMWTDLEYTTENKANIKSGTPIVQPLMLVTWDQGFPYNEQCPTVTTGGSGGHVYVGCVATAMCQVMKYYNYPSTGESSHTNYNWNNGGFGNKTVNFATQTYNWENMPLKANGSNAEMAKINYHAGVAVDMHWGADGSGSQTANIATALKNFFKYSTSLSVISKSNETTWRNTLKAQFDLGRPVVYSGSPASGAGHAWNSDGYDDADFLHMNWGWGGSNNGYFETNNISMNVLEGGAALELNYSQQAIINIYPKTGYPVYCTGSRTINGEQGTLEDGSSNENYQNGVDCQYYINPACGSYVDIKFDRFKLAAGDVVKIYDGATINSSNLLAQYTTTNPPTTSTISSNLGNGILIHFTSDGSENAEGWDLSYTSKYCISNLDITDASGSFTDGSNSCQYKNNVQCKWTIQPTNASSITINFNEFNLASDGSDWVKVYKNATTPTTNEVAKYSATNLPTTPLIVDAPIAVVRFYTNTAEFGNGWAATYTSTITGIDQQPAINNLAIYPNPTNESVNIEFDSDINQNLNIRIYNLIGEKLYTENFEGTNGRLSKTINLSSFSNGVYVLQINGAKNIITEKIVKQ